MVDQMHSAPTLPAFSLPVYESRRIFAERVGQRKLVYLDQNVWIDLRESKTPEAAACLEACRSGVEGGKVLFPLAYPAIAEAVEISDVSTRLRHADLLDALSSSVTFRSSAVLLRLEAEHAWRWLFADEEALVGKEDVFSGFLDHLAEPAVMRFPAGWIREDIAKFMRDVVNKPGVCNVRFMAEQQDWRNDHAQILERYAREMEENRQKRLAEPQPPKPQAFVIALRAERQELISRFVVPAALGSVIAESGLARAPDLLRQFRATKGDGNERRVQQLFARMPIMDQHARLMALNVVETQRRPQPQDFYDVEHGVGLDLTVTHRGVCGCAAYSLRAAAAQPNVGPTAGGCSARVWV
jgi:hypothetical protein